MRKTAFICLVLLLFSAACSKPVNLDDGTAPGMEAAVSVAPESSLQESRLQYDIDSTGSIQKSEAMYTWAMEPQFTGCSLLFIDGIMLVEKNQRGNVKYGFVNSQGELVADTVYDDTKFYIGASSVSSGFSEGLAPVRKGDGWGYIDHNGNEVIEFKYKNAGLFRERLACVLTERGYGYIDVEGKMVIAPAYDYGSEFHKGVAVVQSDGKYGFIGRDGSWLLEPAFDYIDFGRYGYTWIENDILTVTSGDLQGIVRIVNGNVEVVVEPRYTKIFPFAKGEARFVLMEKDENGVYGTDITEGFVNDEGKEIIRWKSDSGMDYMAPNEGMRPFRNSEGLWGFVDMDFSPAIPCRYHQVDGFYDGWSVVYSNDNAGLIDISGDTLMETVYKSIVPLKSEGYIIAGSDDGIFLVSADDFSVISGRYDDIGRGGNILPVIKDGRYGLINSEGKEIISPVFEDCLYFAFWEGYAWVKRGGLWICIGEDGKQLFEQEFDDVSLFEEGYAGVKKQGSWGIIDMSGRTVVPFEFDEAKVVAKDLVRVQQDGKYGFIKLTSTDL